MWDSAMLVGAHAVRRWDLRGTPWSKSTRMAITTCVSIALFMHPWRVSSLAAAPVPIYSTWASA
jgi:hypothetical protein